MNEILAAATIIVSAVMAISTMIKSQITDAKRLPVINVIVGVFIGGGYAISFAHDQFAVFVWAGLIAGLAAGGFYDLGKGILHNPLEENKVDTDDQENNVQ